MLTALQVGILAASALAMTVTVGVACYRAGRIMGWVRGWRAHSEWCKRACDRLGPAAAMRFCEAMIQSADEEIASGRAGERRSPFEREAAERMLGELRNKLH